VNWLAHLILSDPSPTFRIGNLLPDMLPWSELRAMPAEYQGGIECHRLIDRFADTHPVFRRSMGRIEAPFRRYAGVLIDVFYDHFLAHREDLPEAAYTRLMQVWEGNWLGSYAQISGVRRALRGIGKRFRKPVPLGEATIQLVLHEEALGTDFAEFFPELCAYLGKHATRL
jgi:acyl carrier protein phosphodiesterase